jgi:glycosyltransferase involved in cell wall biosynthesis
VFYVVGSGSEVDRLKNLASRLGVAEKIIFLGHLPKSELYNVVKKCDIGIISYQMKGLNTIYCAPNKIYEYAAYGLPIISSPQPTLAGALANNKIGSALLLKDWLSGDWVDSVDIFMDLISNYERYSCAATDFSGKYTWEEVRKPIIQKLKFYIL